MSDESTFLRACKFQKTEYTPIWLMRQAGRYLPQYRKLREKYDFKTLYKTPELAAEITLLPIEILNVDVAIIFSDLLVVPEAMGCEIVYEENAGPRFLSNIKTSKEVSALKDSQCIEELDFVYKAIVLVKKNLKKTPLIGFAGAPWTLATYMTAYNHKAKFIHYLLKRLSECIEKFIILQIKAGIDAVMIFDTWGGILSNDSYKKFSLPYIKNIVATIKKNFNTPIILYSRNSKKLFKTLLKSGADVISIDSTMTLNQARELSNSTTALQGNLDTKFLFKPLHNLKREVIKILRSYGKSSGHIFNLSQGVPPNTPLGNVVELVKIVKAESNVFH